MYGFDRGTPIDRVYIERFLGRHASDISGHVLEVGDDSYTRRFGGGRVQSVEVLDATAANPKATLVIDLNEGGPPDERFDCIICTQTLLLVYDVRAAVGALHRALAPGGVLLVTVPGISRVCQPEDGLWGDYWRFTSTSLARLLADRFGRDAVQVDSYGSLAAATAALRGLAAEELPRGALDERDPDYQVVIAGRAQRAAAAPG
jgi:SAM-dependent methyltransferase